MEVFSTVVNQLDSLIWSMALVGLCLGAGFYLSLRLGFPQVRLIADMLKLLFGDKKSEHGISSFQSFATTVGARVWGILPVWPQLYLLVDLALFSGCG